MYIVKLTGIVWRFVYHTFGDVIHILDGGPTSAFSSLSHVFFCNTFSWQEEERAD